MAEVIGPLIPAAPSNCRGENLNVPNVKDDLRTGNLQAFCLFGQRECNSKFQLN